MNAFEEFMFDENYVLRFYRVDHGLVCTINESMVSELRELEAKLRHQQAEIEALKHWQDTWRPFLKKHFGICNGFCGEYECKENQDVCKRKAQEK